MMDAGALALIVRAGAGYNTIDVAAASARGIYVSNCPGKNAIAVAELAFGLILALDRRIPDNVADLRAGTWNKKEYSKARGLHGRTLGLLGFGSIGQEMARRAQAFGMDVVVWTRRFEREPGADLSAYGWTRRVASRARRSRRRRAPSCEQADVVSVHLALGPETKGFVGAELLAAMKPGAFFVNTARGGGRRLRRARAGRPRAGPARRPRRLQERAGGRDRRRMPTRSSSCPASTARTTSARRPSRRRRRSPPRPSASSRAFKETGRVPNVVNLARRTPATHMLVVRHRDRPGVLAHVFDHLRQADINVQETENIVFEGAEAAVARINLDRAPADALLVEHRLGQPGHHQPATREDSERSPAPRCAPMRLPVHPRMKERNHDHHDPHPQFLLRPRGAARARARRGAARSRRPAGRRHVGDGDQPPLEDLRGHHPEGARPTSARSPAFPPNYKVLFLQGGASLQFSMVPMNLLTEGLTADYIDDRDPGPRRR